MGKLQLALIPIYIIYIFILGFYQYRKRVSAVRSKKINIDYFKTYQFEAPEELKVLQNHFSSQFEVPILFMVTCLAVVVLDKSSIFNLALGFLFILSRLAHSYIHLGSNNLKKRALSFVLGFFVILIIWINILFFEV